jgi:hypothetical protein
MYATSMANVGLIARQRLVIVVALAFVAALYRPEEQTVREGSPEAIGPPEDGDRLQPALVKSRA